MEQAAFIFVSQLTWTAFINKIFCKTENKSTLITYNDFHLDHYARIQLLPSVIVFFLKNHRILCKMKYKQYWLAFREPGIQTRTWSLLYNQMYLYSYKLLLNIKTVPKWLLDIWNLFEGFEPRNHFLIFRGSKSSAEINF